MRQVNNKLKTTQCVILNSAILCSLLYMALTRSNLYSCHPLNIMMTTKPKSEAKRKPTQPGECSQANQLQSGLLLYWLIMHPIPCRLASDLLVWLNWVWNLLASVVMISYLVVAMVTLYEVKILLLVKNSMLFCRKKK